MQNVECWTSNTHQNFFFSVLVLIAQAHFLQIDVSGTYFAFRGNEITPVISTPIGSAYVAKYFSEYASSTVLQVSSPFEGSQYYDHMVEIPNTESYKEHT